MFTDAQSLHMYDVMKYDELLISGLPHPNDTKGRALDIVAVYQKNQPDTEGMHLLLSLYLSISQSHLYLTSISPLSHLYLTSISPLSLLYLTSISSLSHLYLTSISHLSHLYLTSISPLSHLYLTSISPLSHLYISLCSVLS